jgi:hypothetical protein
MKLVLLAGCLVWLMASLAQGQTRAVSVKATFAERLGPLAIGRMGLGQGGLSEEPMWENRIAEVRALGPAMIRLFIQEYFDLLPERGRYQFATLDRSVETIRKAGAEPLMCICFKPRVLFPKIDHGIVEPNDYDEWERLIHALVKHYRDTGAAIKYWEVANEPDIGESGGCPYLFQPASYVRYYQRTVAAIRRADPEARVGGPALASVRSPILPALLDHCEKEKTPLDFVSWHIYSSDPGQVRGTIDYARDLLKKHSGLKAETILDEWNMDLMNPPLDRRFQPCYVLETIWQMKDAGLDASCYYHIRDWHVRPERFAPFMSPQGTAFMTKWWNRMPQFDGLFDFQDNVRPAYSAFKLLARLTGDRLRLASTDARVRGFATHDETFQVSSLLVWNFSEAPVEVELTVDGLPKSMRVRHIVLDALAPSDDENARLRPDPPAEWKAGTHRLQVRFDPYAIHFWSLE